MDSKTGSEFINQARREITVHKEIRTWLVEDHATAAHGLKIWLVKNIDVASILVEESATTAELCIWMLSAVI